MQGWLPEIPLHPTRFSGEVLSAGGGCLPKIPLHPTRFSGEVLSAGVDAFWLRVYE
ncbi:MAG: hypothetical protein LBP51_03515 [Deferribacteraceae bacterium]|nr:hypothetical protein [Deferribacteraceae bacterium]